MTANPWKDLAVKDRWSAEGETDAPPEAVWALLVDLERHLVWGGERYGGKGEYLTGLEAPSGEAKAGTTFTSVGHAHEGTYHDRSTVTAVEAPRLLEFVTETTFRRGKSDTRYTLRHRWEITALEGHTRVTHVQERLGDFDGAPIWFRALFAFPLKQLVGARMATGLLRGGVANLVAMAEEAAPASASDTGPPSYSSQEPTQTG